MRSLYETLFGTKSHAVTQRARKQCPRGARPTVEPLEDRSLATVTTTFSNGVLTIYGDSMVNNVKIVQNDKLKTLDVYDESSGWQSVLLRRTYNYGPGTIRAFLYGGPDTLTYVLAPGSNMYTYRTLDFRMGGGDDTVNIDFRGDGTSVMTGGLEISVLGGGRNDNITASFGRIDDGHISYTAQGGRGEDRLYAFMSGDLNPGSDVLFNLWGGADRDFIYAESALNSSLTVAAGAEFLVDMHGGSGDDQLWSSFVGKFDGNLYLQLHGEDNHDHLGTYLYIQPNSTGPLFVRHWGGDGDDRLYLNIDEPNGSWIPVGSGMFFDWVFVLPSSNSLDVELDGGEGYGFDQSDVTTRWWREVRIVNTEFDH